jgi:hypothetical protein
MLASRIVARLNDNTALWLGKRVANDDYRGHRTIRRRGIAMSSRNTALSLILLTGCVTASRPDAWADSLPTAVGQCTQTTIAKVETRLEGMPGSGSAVSFANGGYQVSYDTVPAITQSRAGDPVTMCLVSIPQGCPPGDNRGRQYKTTDLRTKESWTLPDSEHSCGGA